MVFFGTRFYIDVAPNGAWDVNFSHLITAIHVLSHLITVPGGWTGSNLSRAKSRVFRKIIFFGGVSGDGGHRPYQWWPSARTFVGSVTPW